jgi:nucleotide-binding universal stress UspA family protein
MQDIHAIVVGLELDSECEALTEGSRKAADQALWVARVSGARIRYVHSTFHDVYRDALHGELPLHSGELSPQGLKVLEDQVAATRTAGIEADLTITSNRVWVDIIHMVLRSEAELVVVGKRDETSADGRKLGSVAVMLLRNCPCPVWVVKPDHDLLQKLVLAASDLSPVGDEACRHAARIARLHECELHVVHAYQIPLELQMESSRISDVEYGERVEQLKSRAVAHIRGSVAGIVEDSEKDLEVHVGKGVPSNVIREAVAHLDPDLLVMGTISRGGLAGLLVGSTAERLLERVDCSILAVKPDGFVSPVTLE